MQKQNKFKMLYEYVTASQTGKDSANMGEPQEGPRQMTMMDIMDANKTLKSSESPTAVPVLPAPLSNNHLSVLADMYSMATTTQADIKSAALNPIIKDNDKMLSAAEDMHKKLEKVKDLIESMKSDLDAFSIAK